MIKDFTAIGQGFADELRKIAAAPVGAFRSFIGSASKGIGDVASGATKITGEGGLLSGAGKAWEGAKSLMNAEGKPMGWLGRLKHVVTTDPHAAALAAGGLGAAGVGGAYYAGKSRGRHGY